MAVVKLSLSELRELSISTQAVGQTSKLGYEALNGLGRLSRQARQAFNAHIIDDKGTTMEDYAATGNKIQEIIEDHKRKAYKKANGDQTKLNFILNELLAGEKRIIECNEKDAEVYRAKIDFEFHPVIIDVKKIQTVESYHNRDNASYIFDLQSIFDKEVEIKAFGTDFRVNPLSTFINLDIDGYVELIK